MTPCIADIQGSTFSCIIVNLKDIALTPCNANLEYSTLTPCTAILEVSTMTP